ncbi:MAG TPA: prepilin-type N-terminal cleavage/methylation domain-containing protein [Candidatus Angelobacter sp.]|nr:prepilin-type N-terminal cleavage/methylation domain-containing protein [Candidatus Angelobacter sp.]
MNKKTCAFTIVELPTSPRLRRTSLVKSNRQTLNLSKGFTIVELLVVIVVIGVLAALTIVSYTGISQRATEASLKSDLTNASQQLKMYQVTNSAYPTSLDVNNCLVPASENMCLKPSPGNSYSSYTVNNSSALQTFSLDATNDTTVYRITNNSTPVAVAATPITAIAAISGATTAIGNTLTAGALTPSGATVTYQWQSATTSGGTYADISGATASTYTLVIGDLGKYIKIAATGSGNYSGTVASIASSLTCPTGFIPVPGSATYGTSNFCVMKYEAKNVGGIATSQAAGTPWDIITQIEAITTSSAACTGCHLITEAEWMTIAQNVLGVASNWSGGSVGSGYIYSGHNDNVPPNSLAADANDANGYSGTGQSAPSNQRRTLTLSNGEVIWDLAGNVYDSTSGTVTTGQPGVAGNAYASWIDWPNVTTPGTLAVNVFPSGTGITGASSWTSANGIGQLLSNPTDTVLRGFPRGGAWYDGVVAGVLTLRLNNASDSAGAGRGFRISR